VLAPRAWTLAQSLWVADESRRRPAGPIVDLYCGCGSIGLEAARRSARDVVLVDASGEACRWATRNAMANGLGSRAEVRCSPVSEALAPGERFPLIVADPPYVPRGEVAAYPEDPVTAIDGGPTGLDHFDEILDVVQEHLAPDGVALVQTRGLGQARHVARRARTTAERLRPVAWRVLRPDRAIIALERRHEGPSARETSGDPGDVVSNGPTPGFTSHVETYVDG
jgi:methylase of polypeptide subunit release factors